MKKIISFVLFLILCLLMVACQNNNNKLSRRDNRSPFSASSMSDTGSQVISATESLSNEYINDDDAKKSIYNDLSGNASNIVFKNCELKMDGQPLYNITVSCNSKTYDYRINALNGEIISKEEKTNTTGNTTPGKIDNSSTVEHSLPSEYSNYITEERAKNIVNERVPGSSPSDIVIYLKQDVFPAVYEGNMKFNKFEYTFKIDAVSGEVIDWGCKANYNS